MADGFLASLSHVPQQSRRDKLRILSQHHQPNPFPVYDPSLLQVPADLMTCPSSFPSLVKEEASSSLLRFPINRCALPDPQPSLPENPNHIQDSNPAFLCAQHDLRSSREWGYPSLGGNFTSAGDGTSGQGLSLSLSSRVNCHGNDDQRSLPFELNLERYGSVAVYGGEKGGGSTYLGEVPRGSGPLGPFMGYSLILRGSRFLKPAQKLLEELCEVGRGMFYAERVADEGSGLMEGGGECFSNRDDRRGVGSGDGGELWGRKSRLMSMLDEVCRRYVQYYQQLQDVVASFECVAGLGNAAPFVNLALKAMSKHFKCVKDAIMDQLRFTSKAHRKPADTKDDIAGLGTNERLHIGQRANKNSGYLQQQQPVWRPQRGLPERAVAVLRAWLFEHFLHPYPTDTDKLMLAKQTGLSRCQVSNWFINARVRLWKPMVEEIHTLETQQKHASQMTHRDEKSETQTSSDQPPVSSSAPSASVARIHGPLTPAKRTAVALTCDSSTARNEQMHYLSHVMPGKGIGGVTSGGVTLTLGLHQQNAGLGAVQRLGLAVEATGEGHQVTGGYELQDRQFSRDVYGGRGQILNDFVG